MTLDIAATRNRVALVSCVKTKLDVPAEARDLYVSDWFKKARAYVEAEGVDWYILSAELGLVYPWRLIGPYEKTLADMSARGRRVWAFKVWHQIRDLIPQGTTLEILAGHLYRDELVKLLEPDYFVELPLEGLFFGQQKQELARLTRRIEGAADVAGRAI